MLVLIVMKKDVIEVEYRITGRVQMVMFRDFTMRKARGLGLVGYVTNNEDGSVTAVAQGEQEKLQKLLQFLKRGSFLSRVDDVIATEGLPRERYRKFTIKYT